MSAQNVNINQENEYIARAFRRLEKYEREKEKCLEQNIKNGFYTVFEWKNYGLFRFCEEALKILEKEIPKSPPYLIILSKLLCILSIFLSLCITKPLMNTGFAGVMFIFYFAPMFLTISELCKLSQSLNETWGIYQEFVLILFRRLTYEIDPTDYKPIVEKLRERVLNLDNKRNILNIIYLHFNILFFLTFLLASLYIGHLRYTLEIPEAYHDIVLYVLLSFVFILWSLNMLKNAWGNWRWIRKSKQPGFYRDERSLYVIA